MITTGGGSQSWSSNLAHADEADLDLEAFSSARAVLETWLNAWLLSASQAAAHGREAQPLPPYTHHYLRHCIVRATHPAEDLAVSGVSRKVSMIFSIDPL